MDRLDGFIGDLKVNTDERNGGGPLPAVGQYGLNMVTINIQVSIANSS